VISLRIAARFSIAAAGLILLFETLFGMIAVLGIGFSSVLNVATDLSLTMAFPIYLLGFRSLGTATIGLWLLFVAQWVDMYLNSVPRHFGNLLDGWYGELLLIAIVLTTFSYVAAKKLNGDGRLVKFWSL
jgi:hypothetical protein